MKFTVTLFALISSGVWSLQPALANNRPTARHDQYQLGLASLVQDQGGNLISHGCHNGGFDCFVMAVDPKDGTQKWTSSIPRIMFYPGGLTLGDDGAIWTTGWDTFSQPADSGFVRLNPADGTTLSRDHFNLGVPGGFAVPHTLERTENGDLVSGGVINNETSYFAKFSPLGHLDWAAKAGLPNSNNEIWNTIESSACGYYGSGITWKNGAAAPVGYLMKVDCEGKVLWEKRGGFGEPTGTLETIESIIPTRDGGGILVGYLTTGYRTGFMARFRADGTVAWHKVLELVYPEEMKRVSDHHFVVISRDTNQTQHSSIIYLTGWNDDGDQLWKQSYAQPANTYFDPFELLVTKNGAFAVAGASGPIPATLTAHPAMMKVSNAGKLEWFKSY